MMTFDEIEAEIEAIEARAGQVEDARTLLGLADVVLENWIGARGDVPTIATKEGFRLLALHRQGAKGDPSFNACRETCREVVYHYNLVTGVAGHPETHHHVGRNVRMMALVAKHLCLFVGGKMETAALGEFCCAAKPVRAGEDAAAHDAENSIEAGARLGL